MPSHSAWAQIRVTETDQPKQEEKTTLSHLVVLRVDSRETAEKILEDEMIKALQA